MRRVIAVLASATLLLSLASTAVAAPRNQQPARSYIITLNADADLDASVRGLGQRHAFAPDHVYRRVLHGFAARLTPAQADALRAEGSVRTVLEDQPVAAIAQTLPTGVNRIQADESSTRAGDGSGSVTGIAVAVIDTGIDIDHPDLNVDGGRNCSTGRSYDDGNGHGTHVAGTIGARDNSIGVVGVAPDVSLYAVRVLDNRGSGSWASVICGVDWVAANAATLGIKVANMSLGGTGTEGHCLDGGLRQAICEATAAGVTFVVAAGNSNADFAGYVPATYPEVLTVTAMADSDGAPGGERWIATCRADQEETPADFSNFAVGAEDRDHSIAGPGVCINSTWKGGGYNTISGTSMASPHVAGAATLCIAGGHCAGTPAQIIDKLQADAAAADSANTYGFSGDPNSGPSATRHYGFLVYAGGY